jgi:hypothetical protein
MLDFLLSVKTNFSIPNLRYMDEAKSSETGYSRNMLGFPATKFHTEPIIDSRLEVRMNPTIKDLVINRPTTKKKRSKQHKKEESTVEAAESVGENQSVWLDSSLKAEIAKLK